MAEQKVISSDSHITEPPDLWISRADHKWKDKVPRIVREEGDNDAWYCDGVKFGGVSAGAQTGIRFEGQDKFKKTATVEDIRPGGYIPEEHVKDMEADGVYAGILYPTTGLGLFRFDPGTEALNVFFSIYNDWLAEFCSAYPSRLKGIAMINLEDVQAGVKELERCAKIGLIGAMISTYPEGVGYYTGTGFDSPRYEPFWAAAHDMNMPISLHFTTNRPVPGEKIGILGGSKLALYTNIDHWVRMSLAHIIFSGVFERYPKLQVGSVENELSWASHFLDRLDYTYTQKVPGEDWRPFKDDMLPSDFFHRNVFLSFQEDGLGIRDRHIIGVDNLLWGSDYPHPESTFPRSQQIIQEILADCTEEEKAKIVRGNTARVYNIS